MNLNICMFASRMKAPAVALAGSLLLSMPAFANADNGRPADRVTIREMRMLRPDARGKELRQLVRSQRAVPVGFAPQKATDQRRQDNVLQNRHEPRISNVSQYLKENGNSRSVAQGLQLDLSSDERMIVLGSKLFADSDSYKINVGGQEKVLIAGDTVSAAEYVALQQVIAGGAQNLVVDHSGRGIDGQFDLNSISEGGANLRAASLVIPESVVAVGDFSRKADGLRVTNDLVNYGSIYATSGNPNANTVRIGARDINNELGGLISTEASDYLTGSKKTNLSLSADRNLRNSGVIVSSGDLELSAAGAITNTGAAQADGNITVASSIVTNGGTITSGNGNVNLAGLSAADLTVNNAGGAINALNGAINVRSEQYNGTGNSTIIGGDLFSRELNLFTGQGIADVFVNELTGVLQSSGHAAHVQSNTETLNIGSQCLLGDPTYYNTGNISIQGDIIVGEDLAIISSGVINTGLVNLTIRARDVSGAGRNIFIIAGAEILSGGTQTGAALSGQPPITQNSLTDVTLSGNASSTGGLINFAFAGGTMLIDASASGTNQNGGNVVLAAYDGPTFAGLISLPSTSTIQTFGTGTGNNGNVDIIYGEQTSGGPSIVTEIGTINTRNGTGIAGTVNIVNSQPTSSNSSPITFNSLGAITTGNNFTFSSLSAAGNVPVLIENVFSSGDVTISSGGAVTVGVVTASGNVPGDNGKIVSITSTNANVTAIGAIDVTGVTSGGGGAVFVNSNDGVNATSLEQINADSGPTGGQGGIIDISNAGTGGITLSGGLSSRGVNDGSIDIDATSGQLLVAGNTFVEVRTNSVSGTDGTITLNADNIQINPGASMSLQGGIVDVTTTGGGIFAPGASFTAQQSGQLNLNLSNNLIDARGVAGAGGSIDLRAPAVNFASSSTNPLRLLTDGDANNSAGGIFFLSENAVATVIGQPAVKKLPKGPTDFLVLSANAGDSAIANGGNLQVSVGGSLFVDPAGLQNSPSSLGGDAGGVSLTSGQTVTKKGSPLVVTGSLNADGINGGAGSVVGLFSNFKKDFVLGATKVPKNGIVGTVSAIGTGGSAFISNLSGGVNVLSNTAVGGETITLQAGGKGRIRASKGVVVTAGDTINLGSNSGDVVLNFSAPNFTFGSASGDFELVNTNAGLTTLLGATTGGSISVTTAGGLSIAGDVSTTNGDIAISANSFFDDLSVQAGVQIAANNGSLLLQNVDPSGNIVLNDNSVVETTGAGGVVSIIVGPNAGKPLNPSPPFVPPATLLVNNTGKGLVFFGASPGQILALGAVPSNLNATNKNVILNVPTGSIGSIAIHDNVRIEADPPSRSGAPNFVWSSYHGSGRSRW